MYWSTYWSSASQDINYWYIGQVSVVDRCVGWVLLVHESSMIDWHIDWSSVNYRLTVQNQDSIDSLHTMYQWTIGQVSVRVGGVLVEHRECWDKPYMYLDVNNEQQKNNYYSFGRSNSTRIGKAKGTINFSRSGFLHCLVQLIN